MAQKDQIAEQCKLAFDFLQKLYFEVSYFIKEVEGILRDKDFRIGKPSGYQISSRSSSGLEPVNVNMWLLRKFAVFFAPKDKITLARGQTTLPIEQPTRVLYLRIILDDNTLQCPTVYAGVLYDIQKTPTTGWVKKFEQAMQHIEYNDAKIFKGNLRSLDYEDAHIRFKGHLLEIPLFEINDSEAISTKIVDPCLKLFEKHGN
jgi:hypothetical protein